MIRKKRMSKGIAKILSSLLVFGMVAGLVPAVPGGTVHAKAAETHTHCVCGTGNLTVDGHKCNKETWTGINKLSDIKGEGHYYLTQNVQLNQVWVCPTGVKLCLNGYSITRTNCVADSTDGNNAVIKINKGTQFWLTDCKTPDKVGKITHAEGASGEGVYNAGTFYMYNGKISGNDGGVKNSKLFSMYGGTITANTSTKKGGGVYNSGTGEITMFGGQIANNTANQKGGGVYNDDGKIMMYEGQITGNTANQEGGGVYHRSYNFTMSGGTISGNSADNGGGVYNEEGTFEMSGGQIADNKVNTCGGGVYNHTGEFTMSGGTISGNVSDWFGGGVYQNGSTLTLSGIVDITGNKVNDNENNLHLGIGNIVNANGLADGAVIGVTTVAIPKENSPVTIASEAASAAHFRSDNSNYVIGTDKDGKVVLQCKEKLPTVPDPEPKTFTYDTTEHTGIELGENYIVASGTNSAIDAGTYEVIIKPFAGKTWEDGTENEKTFNWEITKASQNAPTGLVGEKTITSGGSDGKITGVNENMEYRKSGDSSYIACTGTEIIGLSAGTYEVRYKGDKNHEESPAFVVTVPDADKPVYILEIINGTGNGTYVEGTVVTITANPAADGKVFDKWVKMYGDAVIADENSATTTVTTKIAPTTIKATYKDSETTPTPNPEPTPNPNPEPTPTPTPTPNPTPEATTPTPDPAPATSTPAASTTTAPAQVMYDILDGAGSSWTQNTDGSLAIRGSGEISKFREVKVDGVTVDPVNYTVTEGSTIITFKPEYLKSLSAGNHSFELVWTDGTAATNFTVAENADQSAKSPKTGEDFSMALCTVLLMISCAGLAGMFAKRKRNHAR